MNLLKFICSFGVAGTERQVVSLAFALDPARFRVHFGCLNRWGELLEEIEARQMPVTQYGFRGFKHPSLIPAQVRFVRDLRRQKIDVVHSYGFYGNLFAVPAARLAGVKVIASIRDMGVYLSRRQQHAQRIVCRFADGILVNAAAIRDWLVADGYDAARISVIPNGLDPCRFDSIARTGRLRKELGLPETTALIGVVGRITERKGLDVFIRAAARVSQRFPEARFVVIGDSGRFVRAGHSIVEVKEYQHELEKLAAQLGLTGRIIFTGSRRDIERVLPELTVSVQPSLSEGMSNTLLESLAAGLPVVATRVGGAPELISSGENGILVAPGDCEALATAICEVLAAPETARRMGSAARQAVLTNHAMSRIAERTSEIYDRLTKCGPQAAVRPSLKTIWEE